MTARLLLAVLLLAALSGAAAETYEVGPGKAYESIGQVPWAALAPGDSELIHWRPEPYREKWVICREGAEEGPVNSAASSVRTSKATTPVSATRPRRTSSSFGPFELSPPSAEPSPRLAARR